VNAPNKIFWIIRVFLLFVHLLPLDAVCLFQLHCVLQMIIFQYFSFQQDRIIYGLNSYTFFVNVVSSFLYILSLLFKLNVFVVKIVSMLHWSVSVYPSSCSNKFHFFSLHSYLTASFHCSYFTSMQGTATGLYNFIFFYLWFLPHTKIPPPQFMSWDLWEVSPLSRQHGASSSYSWRRQTPDMEVSHEHTE
jgi:hypothetical protein